MRTRRLGVLLLATTLLGCGGKPAPSGPAGEVLVYDTAAFAGSWRIGSRFTSRPATAVDVDLGAEIILRLVPTVATGFDVFLDELVITGHMGPQTFDERLTAASPGMAGAFASRLSSLTLDPHGAATGTRNDDNLLARQGADLIDTAIFLIPPTPEGPVEVGATWTASRVVPTASDVSDVTAEIAYQLAAIEACPPPLDGRCARITSAADTGERAVTIDGQNARLGYTLEGESVLQLGGALVEASARMSMLMTTGGMTLDLDGTIRYQRVETSAR